MNAKRYIFVSARPINSISDYHLIVPIIDLVQSPSFVLSVSEDLALKYFDAIHNSNKSKEISSPSCKVSYEYMFEVVETILDSDYTLYKINLIKDEHHYRPVLNYHISNIAEEYIKLSKSELHKMLIQRVLKELDS